MPLLINMGVESCIYFLPCFDCFVHYLVVQRTGSCYTVCLLVSEKALGFLHPLKEILMILLNLFSPLLSSFIILFFLLCRFLMSLMGWGKTMFMLMCSYIMLLSSQKNEDWVHFGAQACIE